jgi:hypothetical protein
LPVGALTDPQRKAGRRLDPWKSPVLIGFIQIRSFRRGGEGDLALL